jgi:plastocyanin domain-containing protein
LASPPNGTPRALSGLDRRLAEEASTHLETTDMLSKLVTAVIALALATPFVAQAAPPPVQVIEMQVTGEGFVPDHLKVKKGQKVRLVVTRKTERTCATEIVIRDQGINQKLPLDKPVTVEFTPTKSGQLRYACGMDMISGVIVVE